MKDKIREVLFKVQGDTSDLAQGMTIDEAIPIVVELLKKVSVADPIRQVYEKWRGKFKAGMFIPVRHEKDFPMVMDMWNAIKTYCEGEE